MTRPTNGKESLAEMNQQLKQIKQNKRAIRSLVKEVKDQVGVMKDVIEANNAGDVSD